MKKYPFDPVATDITQYLGGNSFSAAAGSRSYYDLRNAAADEARRILDSELPPEVRDFLCWLIRTDPHMSAKFAAFMACKRIGVDTK